ncbi:MAG TPA: serine/threonine-protein kinase, partial [Gemmatimonadales bacterium]|nr:serine/threonine-protein kinase [Gemmatimonadales bacterium]
HRRGIVHRDVKPQNILLDHDTGRALVTDFGIAGAVGGATPSGAPGDDRLTGLGLVVGTPRYMSPEQAAGSRELGPASDVYALGVVLYEMLAGAYPYQLSSPSGAAAAHLVQAPLPLRQRRPEVPLAAELALDRLLAKDPAKRIATGDAAATLLDGLLTPSGIAALPGMPAHLGARGWGVLALIALLLGAVGWWAFARPGPPRGVDPRRSLLIGFFDATQDSSLGWLRVGGVKLLAAQLQRWEDLQVVDAERLLDLARRAHVRADQPLSLDDARRMARAAGVWTTSIGSVFKFGDRITVDLKLYDVTSGTELTRDSAVVESDSALPTAFRVLAERVLGRLGAPVAQLQGAEPPTRSIAAWAAYVRGLEQRSRWEVDSARGAFAEATAADPGFALAWLERSRLALTDAWLRGSREYADLADSALAHGTDRPPRERALLQAYNDLVHARFADARTGLGALVARDTTDALAWQLLGMAWQYDLTLDTTGGRAHLPASYTQALRAYERALALDESDHTLFADVAELWGDVGDKEGVEVPGYLHPPAGGLTSVYDRIEDASWLPVYTGDSIVMVPAESVALRYPPQLLDSLRARARARALAVTRRWLDAAPFEGSAHLRLGYLHYAAQDYDSALAALARAQRLGVPEEEQLPFVRMQVYAAAQRDGELLRLADSLGAIGPDSAFRRYAIQSVALANVWVLTGRQAEAGRLMGLLQADVGQRSPELRRFFDASPDYFGLLLRSTSGTMSRDDVREASAAYRRGMGRLSGAGARTVRSIVRTPIRVAAASAGDTATLATWPQEGGDTNWALEAWARAEAGDTARARAAMARVGRTDTVTSLLRLWALARTAEALGRPDDALRWYARIDSLPTQLFNGLDPTITLRARALPAAAAIYEARGDTAAARARYQRFLTLWRGADPALQPEVALAERALVELGRKAD